MKKIFFIFLLILPINVHSIIYPITPKYASIKKEKAYSRHNASFDADIEWIYQKKNLPILITNEHGNWREIIDIYGDDYNPVPDKWDAIAKYKYHLVSPLAFSNERKPPSPNIPSNTVIKDSISK